MQRVADCADIGDYEKTVEVEVAVADTSAPALTVAPVSSFVSNVHLIHIVLFLQDTPLLIAAEATDTLCDVAIPIFVADALHSLPAPHSDHHDEGCEAGDSARVSWLHTYFCCL
jgi:hypothetical protein